MSAPTPIIVNKTGAELPPEIASMDLSCLQWREIEDRCRRVGFRCYIRAVTTEQISGVAPAELVIEAPRTYYAEVARG